MLCLNQPRASCVRAHNRLAVAIPTLPCSSAARAPLGRTLENDAHRRYPCCLVCVGGAHNACFAYARARHGIPRTQERISGPPLRHQGKCMRWTNAVKRREAAARFRIVVGCNDIHQLRVCPSVTSGSLFSFGCRMGRQRLLDDPPDEPSRPLFLDDPLWGNHSARAEPTSRDPHMFLCGMRQVSSKPESDTTCRWRCATSRSRPRGMRSGKGQALLSVTTQAPSQSTDEQTGGGIGQRPELGGTASPSRMPGQASEIRLVRPAGSLMPASFC